MTTLHSLNITQLDSFYKNGYLRIPNVVPESLLKKLRELFDELMYVNTDENDKAFHIKDGKKFVTSLDKLTNKGNLSCLELLGSPFILDIAETICGADFFSIQEFAVIKELGDDIPVLWHQDMLHKRGGNCFTMGIYLDDANEKDGALRIVPGSHLAGKSICELRNEPFIETPVKAGDIQIHDMMLAHCSEPLQKSAIRRVIYFEFLSANHVKNEQIYIEEAVQLRMDLLKVAIAYYRQLHPQEKLFLGKNKQYQFLNPINDIKQTLEQIYKTPVHAKPSAYCFEHIF